MQVQMLNGNAKCKCKCTMEVQMHNGSASRKTTTQQTHKGKHKWGNMMDGHPSFEEELCRRLSSWHLAFGI